MPPQSSPSPEQQPQRQPQDPERPSRMAQIKERARHLGEIAYTRWNSEGRPGPGEMAWRASGYLAMAAVFAGPFTVKTVDSVFDTHIADSMANVRTTDGHPLVQYGQTIVQYVGEYAGGEERPDTAPTPEK